MTIGLNDPKKEEEVSLLYSTTTPTVTATPIDSENLEPNQKYEQTAPYQDVESLTTFTTATTTTATAFAHHSNYSQDQNPIIAEDVKTLEDPQTRMAFIRKVYCILAAQILVTGALSAFMVLHKPTQTFVLGNAWTVYVASAFTLVFIFSLICFQRKHPQNIILLSLFTLAMSFVVGSTTTAYCAVGYQGVVLEAVFLTGVVFIGLTLFTFQSRIDFSFMGAFLSMGLGVLILWGFLSMLFGFRAGYFYSLLGCIIFCGYILFDTWLIMESMSPEDYVVAAIALYLDIVNLFLYILSLLAQSSNDY